MKATTNDRKVGSAARGKKLAVPAGDRAPKSQRVEARFSPEVKQLAERAASVSGFSLTDYLTNLVRNDAPGRLKKHEEVALSNERFDRFIAACEAVAEPSQKLKAAARKLDEEGL